MSSFALVANWHDWRSVALLAQWHDWCASFSTARGYSRPAHLRNETEPADDLDALLVKTLEQEIARFNLDDQRIINHIARYAWDGTEIPAQFRPRAMNIVLILEKRLTAAGVI